MAAHLWTIKPGRHVNVLIEQNSRANAAARGARTMLASLRPRRGPRREHAWNPPVGWAGYFRESALRRCSGPTPIHIPPLDRARDRRQSAIRIPQSAIEESRAGAKARYPPIPALARRPVLSLSPSPCVLSTGEAAVRPVGLRRGPQRISSASSLRVARAFFSSWRTRSRVRPMAWPISLNVRGGPS